MLRYIRAMKIIREILRLLWKVVRILLGRLIGWIVKKVWVYVAIAVAIVVLAIVLIATC